MPAVGIHTATRSLFGNNLSNSLNGEIKMQGTIYDKREFCLGGKNLE